MPADSVAKAGAIAIAAKAARKAAQQSVMPETTTKARSGAARNYTGINSDVLDEQQRPPDPERAASALMAIPSPDDYGDWRDISWSAKAAGVDFETVLAWSAPDSDDALLTIWNSYDPERKGGVGAGTLYRRAIENGWSRLTGAVAAEKPALGGPSASQYRLLSRDDLAALPPMQWRVRGVFPACGLAAIYGPSGSGKSFLAMDMGSAIAEGSNWFGQRTIAAPVVYVALEGEAGFKARAQALEVQRGCNLPAGFQMVLQPFSLVSADVVALAKVVPNGAVVFLDTLNRAAPTADENSSKDMGEILAYAKRLQSLTNGLVVLVHHTGKDTTKGLRGHSSLLAAMDSALEVSRSGDNREWKVAKAKDGEDGKLHGFRLKVVGLGHDDVGDPVSSCAVESVSAPTHRAPQPSGAHQVLAMGVLVPLFNAGAIGSPGAPPSARCIQLDDAVGAVALRMPVGAARRRTRAKTVISDLVGRGVMGVYEGALWQM
jgi:hypothetical protein